MMGKLLAVHQEQDSPSAISDETLVAGVAKGDAAALAALYRRHCTGVYRFVSRLAGVDANDLDDLVQATFIAVHQSAVRFAATSSVRTWIFGIASRIVGKHVRTEVRRRSKHARAGELAVEPAKPDAVVAQRDALARISDALATLPHEQRSIFVLCVIEEVSGKEAASVLGIREGTLWRKLHEARSELRRALEEP